MYPAAPGPPRNVKLHVTSNRTLSVTYDPPDDNNGAIVTRYKSKSQSVGNKSAETILCLLLFIV